jgi:hypothetical protein
MRSATISALCVLLLLICSPGPVAGQSNLPSTSSPPSQVLPAPTKFSESQGVTEAKSVPPGANSLDEPRNAPPSWTKKPFVWTATVESIKEKLSRCRQTLEKIQPGCTLPPNGKKEQ